MSSPGCFLFGFLLVSCQVFLDSYGPAENKKPGNCFGFSLISGKLVGQKKLIGIEGKLIVARQIS